MIRFLKNSLQLLAQNISFFFIGDEGVLDDTPVSAELWDDEKLWVDVKQWVDQAGE